MPPDIGARIRAFRRSHGLSQEAIAAQMQLRGHSTLTQKRLSEIELGTREVSAAEAISFARVFGLPISELLGVEDYEPR